jgi:diguanylate cyclase (GGDEF)-like protein/PAS domain S-box-containing protein
MNELRILFAAIPVDNVARLVSHLQAEGCVLRHGQANDALALENELQWQWDALIVYPAEHLPLATVIDALRCRELDIPVLVLNDGAFNWPLAEVMRCGAQDCFTLDVLERLLPTIQREMVSAALRANLREQVVTDYLMQEIDQLILLGYDLVSLNQRICRRMAELFDFKLVWIGAKLPDGSVEPVASAGETAYLNGISVRWDDTPEGQGTTGKAIRGNKPETMRADSPRFLPWRKRAEEYGMRSLLALPLGIKGDVVGVLVMYSANENIFDKLTVGRLSAFAGRVTVAMLGAQEQQELRLMQAAMSNAANGMFITRIDGAIEWLNDALVRFSGYKSEELMGANPSLFGSGLHEQSFWADMWTTILRGEPWRGDVVNRNKSGNLYTVAQSISPLYNDKGELTHFLAAQQDISEKKRLEEEIHYLAYHDPLTHLPNRMLFRDRVQQAIAQAQRTQNRLAVMFIDLDGFKAVNDIHGHSSGDFLLEQVAERLRLCVRAGDTVARLGGDEFTVLLRDVGDRENIERVAQKLLAVALQPYDLDCKQPPAVSFSIGISVYPQDGDSFDALLSHADQAMYESKQNGKNRYTFYGNF